MYFVYILQNDLSMLYIGISDNVERRIHEHNARRGAKYTKYLPSYKIVFLEQYSTLGEARKREVQIKKWRREKKDMLIARYKQGLSTKIQNN